MKFRIRLTRNIRQESFVVFEAPSVAALDALSASDIARSATGDWEDVDDLGTFPEIDYVERLAGDDERATMEVTANGTVKEL